MSKIKLQITMDDNLLAEVDNYCDDNHINRSALISQALVEVLNRQKVINSISELSLALAKSCELGSIDEVTQVKIRQFEALCKLMSKQ